MNTSATSADRQHGPSLQASFCRPFCSQDPDPCRVPHLAPILAPRLSERLRSDRQRYSYDARPRLSFFSSSPMQWTLASPSQHHSSTAICSTDAEVTSHLPTVLPDPGPSLSSSDLIPPSRFLFRFEIPRPLPIHHQHHQRLKYPFDVEAAYRGPSAHSLGPFWPCGRTTARCCRIAGNTLVGR